MIFNSRAVSLSSLLNLTVSSRNGRKLKVCQHLSKLLCFHSFDIFINFSVLVSSNCSSPKTIQFKVVTSIILISRPNFDLNDLGLLITGDRANAKAAKHVHLAWCLSMTSFTNKRSVLCRAREKRLSRGTDGHEPEK